MNFRNFRAGAVFLFLFSILVNAETHALEEKVKAGEDPFSAALKDREIEKVKAGEGEHPVGKVDKVITTGEGTLSHAPKGPVDASGATHEVHAANAGFNTIGEYEANAHLFLEEQNRAEEALQKFRKKMQQVASDHRRKASEYAVKAQQSRETLRRLASAPADDKQLPAGSRYQGTEIPASPRAVARNQGQPGKLSMQRGPQLDSETSEKIADHSPKADSASPVLDGLGFTSNLSPNQEQSAKKDSTIAVADAQEESSAQKKPESKYVLGKASNRVQGKGKKSLRDSLREALRKPASTGVAEETANSSSGASNAARAALQEISDLASNQAGGIQQGELKSVAFTMNGAETDAEVRRLQQGVPERQSAPEVLGKESAGLFERVREAHKRSQRSGRLTVTKT